MSVAVASCIFRWFGCRRIANGLVVAAGATAYLFSTILVGDALLRPLERQYPPLRVGQSFPLVSWVVVLGSDYTPRDGIPVTGALDADGLVRIVEAVRLAREYQPIRILASGGARPGFAPPAQGYAELARDLGINPASITMSDEPLDTASEAREVVKLLGNTPFLLVTSAYHMARAMRLMRNAGAQAVPAPTGQLTHELESMNWHRFLPTSGGLRKSERALHEYLGLLAIAFGVA